MNGDMEKYEEHVKVEVIEHESDEIKLRPRPVLRFYLRGKRQL